MTKYYTNENENEENHKQQQHNNIGSPTVKNGNTTTILGMSRRFPHTNSPLRSKGSKSTSKNDNGSSIRKINTNSKQHHNINSNSTQQLGLQNVQHRDDKISPTSLARHSTDESLAEYSWSNNGNGVYSPTPTQHKTAKNVHHNVDGRQPASPPNLTDNATDIAYSSSSSSSSSYTTRTGLQQRRFNNSNNNNSNINGTSPSTKEYFAMLSPDTNRSNCPPRSFNQIRPTKVHVSIMTKHRLLILSAALGLACLGYIVEIRQVLLNGGQWNGSSTRRSNSNSNGDWLMNLPTSLPPNHQEVRSENFAFNNNLVAAHSSGYLDDEVPVHINIDMQAERKRVQSSLKHRAEQRRLRTQPPSVYPTVVPEVSTVEEEETESKLESFTPPQLTLDLPAHRVLYNDNIQESGRRLNEDNNINKSVHRRLQQIDNPQPQQQQQQYPPICGLQAQEASQMNPNNYPPSAHIGPRSRVVITGVLSQVGMELVLQLYEQCGVTVIIGIDSSYPNTRHDRVDMIESRYKYLQRRVPGFQRLMVPVFGIHPHPKIGEEIRFESMDQSFDLVSRLKPSHIVHLAGMEEGHGEHVDYGDVVDASPFSDGGKSAMMRRFESMLSMEQVFKSVSNGKTSQPQVVYISSNEAENLSGVSMHSNTNGSASPAASVYGTSSLVKEVLASFYYFHYGVDSVGLRVPNVFGPFSRPGSLMYDLVERTIRNAAGKDTETVPKYHLDRDRYDLLNIAAKREGAMSGAQEQVTFVYDVASAIVAALQFKKDYTNLEIDPNGPMLFRIGSKLTTSMEEMKDRLETLIPPHDENYEAWPTTTDRALTLLNNNVPGIATRDNERNWNLLGWSHKSSLQDSTKTMLAWQILKAYPYGLKETVPAYSRFQDLLEDSLPTLSYHSLPCASGCRWQGEMCSDSPWDAVIETTKEITQTCPYVLYTVDLRPELEVFEKQSSPSGRQGWEQWFCKIAFVSSSSKLAQLHYASELSSNDPMDEWNGTNKQGQWIIVVVPGTQYSMPEYERSMAKLSPTNLFNERVEKAMYVNHRRVILTTDQAVGVMQHLEMKERNSPEKKTIVDEKTKENVDIWLPPHPHRHSVFFTNKYSFEEGYDTSSVKNLARFVMQSAGIAETKDIRAQVQFYEQTAHLVRTNMQRSPNYQEFNQENLFPYDFLRSTWLLHELNSEEGRNLRCEMYEEHSLWGNAEMEDMSMGYVLARRKVKMQLGQMVDNKGPEEWFPFLEPNELDDEDFSSPIYIDYLESSQKVSTDGKGHEYYISFLPQKLK